MSDKLDTTDIKTDSESHESEDEDVSDILTLAESSNAPQINLEGGELGHEVPQEVPRPQTRAQRRGAMVFGRGQEVMQQMPEQSRRRWTLHAQDILGLPSRTAQNGIMSSALATSARIDEQVLQPGQGPHCATALREQPALLENDDFRGFVEALEIFEAKPLPRSAEDAAVLRESALQTLGKVSDNEVMAKACQDVIDRLKGFELADRILSAGRPPWDLRKGQEMMATKIELDLLSIPEDQRQFTKLRGAGVNESFWIKRSGNEDGETKTSFLCKPATRPDPEYPVVPGIPDGGEVIREAVAGQLGKALGRSMALDLDIPETHVVSLPKSYFPNRGQDEPNELTCSVQEARPNIGDARNLPRKALDRIPPSQCASLVFLDMVSLNTDRHGGNVLLTGSGDIIPIDHGGIMPSITTDGMNRLENTMGAPYNVASIMPGAHQPMTREMAQGLQGLDPNAMFEELKQTRDQLALDNPSMNGLLNDESLKMSVRSTRFLMLAGRVVGKKGEMLSPAAIQTAFAANVRTLGQLPVGPRDRDNRAFDKAAKKILEQTLKDQPLIEQFSLMDAQSMEALQLRALELGWDITPHGKSMSVHLGVDPALALRIVAAGLRKPEGMDSSVATARQVLDGNRRARNLAPEALQDVVIQAELATLKVILTLTSGSEQMGEEQLDKIADRFARSQPAQRRELVASLTQRLIDRQRQQFGDYRREWILRPHDIENVEANLDLMLYKSVASSLTSIRTAIGRNAYERQVGN